MTEGLCHDVDAAGPEANHTRSLPRAAAQLAAATLWRGGRPQPLVQGDVVA